MPGRASHACYGSPVDRRHKQQAGSGVPACFLHILVLLPAEMVVLSFFAIFFPRRIIRRTTDATALSVGSNVVTLIPHLNRIELAEFNTIVISGELLINRPFSRIVTLLPRSDLRSESRCVKDAPIKTLAFENTNLSTSQGSSASCF